MRRGVGAGIVAFLLLGICALGDTQAAVTYTDPDGAFSFSVPDGYSMIPNGPIPALVTFGPADSAHATFSVDAGEIPTDRDAPVTLDSLVADFQGALASNYGTMTPGVEPVQTLMFGGEAARRVDFVQTEDGVRYHGVIVFALHRGMIWSIIVRAEPKEYDTVVRQMRVVIDSFTFLSGASGTLTPIPPVSPTAGSTPPSFLRRLSEG